MRKRVAVHAHLDLRSLTYRSVSTPPHFLHGSLERLTHFHDEIVVGGGDVQHVVPEQRERYRSAAVSVHSIRLKKRDSPETKLMIQPLTSRAALDTRLVAPFLARAPFIAPLSALFPRVLALLPVPFLEARRCVVRARVTDLVALAMASSSQLIATLGRRGLSDAGELSFLAEAYRGRRRNSGT